MLIGQSWYFTPVVVDKDAKKTEQLTKMGFSTFLGDFCMSEVLKDAGIWIGVIFASFYISRTMFIPIIGRLS